MKTFTLSQLKNLFIVFFFFVSLPLIKAQTFNILPSNTRTMTLACDSPFVGDTVLVFNPTSNDLFLSYTVISNTLPMGNDINDSGGCWTYQFCDWRNCKPVLPAGTITLSDTIKPNSQNRSMILDIKAFHNKGQGSLILKLFETGNPSNFQIVTWNVTGCTAGNVCTAGISENVNNTDFIVYPNPAEDFVNVEITSGYSKTGSIQVYNFVGDKLMEFNGIKNNIQKIDLTKLPAGAYFVKYYNGEGTSVKKIFKTR